MGVSVFLASGLLSEGIQDEVVDFFLSLRLRWSTEPRLPRTQQSCSLKSKKCVEMAGIVVERNGQGIADGILQILAQLEDAVQLPSLPLPSHWYGGGRYLCLAAGTTSACTTLGFSPVMFK